MTGDATSRDTKSKPADLWPVFLGLALVLGFFLAHQAWSTGFFTPSFGLVEAILLYGALLTGLVPPVLGSLHINHKTELVTLLVTAVFWTGAAAWFYLQFPFDFAHLTAVMPGQIRFLLSWVTNETGRIIMGVALVGAAALIPFYTIQYAQLGKHARTARAQ